MKPIMACFGMLALVSVAGTAMAQPVPTGACCFLPCYVCQDNVTQQECEQQDGIYFGDGTVCAPNP